MSRIVSFRGLLADDAQERISLETKRGEKGYRITKLATIPNKSGTATGEHTIKIFKIQQTTATAAIDFSDNTLLGVAYIENGSGVGNMQPDVVIFDNEIFNQDIYITHTDESGTEACNYYIELEQMDLALDEATVATLKDIRNND